MLPVAEALRLGHALADLADTIALDSFRAGTEVMRKPDGTPVTAADRAIERAQRELVAAEHPTAGVLGEEFPPVAGEEERWVLDPIDGTARFSTGDPRFASLIALERGGRVVVAVVSAPALGMRWSAATGAGAELRGPDGVTRPQPSSRRTADGARALLVGGGSRHVPLPQLPGSAGTAVRLGRLGIVVVPGSTSWEVVRVADGTYDAAITAGRWWDVAPLALIVHEAGGRARLFGSPATDRHLTVVASNVALDAAVMGAVARSGNA
jgi:histidinol-phosphatase